MKVKKAIIPVAGLGTRFLPFTKACPKEMLPIVDKPAIQLIVEEAHRAGIEDILLVTNRGKTSIENHFDRAVELELSLEKNKKEEELKIVRDITNLCNIYSIRQKETKGLGHAILCGKEFVGDEPFAILLGDDLVYNEESPAIGQLIGEFERTNNSILGCKRVSDEQIVKYGSLGGEKIGEDLYRVDYLVEKPKLEEAPSNIGVVGRHVLRPEIFKYLERTKPGYGGEIQLTDALAMMAKDMDVYGYVFDGIRYDTGDKFGYLTAVCEYALRDEKLKDEFSTYLKKLVENL